MRSGALPDPLEPHVCTCCSRIAVSDFEFVTAFELTLVVRVVARRGTRVRNYNSDSVFKDRSADYPLKGSANLSLVSVLVKLESAPVFPPIV